MRVCWRRVDGPARDTDVLLAISDTSGVQAREDSGWQPNKPNELAHRGLGTSPFAEDILTASTCLMPPQAAAGGPSLSGLKRLRPCLGAGLQVFLLVLIIHELPIITVEGTHPG